MKIRLILKRILIAIASLCLVIVLGFFALSFLLWHKAWRHPSYQDMKAQAASAIVQVGGAEVLEKEAKYLLEHFGAARGNSRSIYYNERQYCPVITKLDSILSPKNGSQFWTSGISIDGDVPNHVEVPFGTHAYYLYVWIFDGEHIPSRHIEGLEHLTSTVYLANERFLADKKEQKLFNVNSASQTRD